MSKNIIICCDGTGNEYGINNTNVVHLYDIAHKGPDQACYYDPGIGTGNWEYDENSSTLRSLSDQATGFGLQKNVEEAYRYLMWIHEPGDRVFLFGFSRGAFTVRSLAGMLRKVGLLHTKFDLNMLEYASKIYNQFNNDTVAQGFKDTFSRPCPVYCIGVWDTVDSLSMNAGKRFHNHQLDPTIPHAFHALAIDEFRADFKPCLWDENFKPVSQTIEQVWFIGAHSDVGGSYPERGLSDIALKWMTEKVVSVGMQVNPEKYTALLTKRDDPDAEIHDSYSGVWRIRGRKARDIPPGSKIHRSVFARKNYSPGNIPKDAKVVD